MDNLIFRNSNAYNCNNIIYCLFILLQFIFSKLYLKCVLGVTKTKHQITQKNKRTIIYTNEVYASERLKTRWSTLYICIDGDKTKGTHFSKFTF